MTDEDSKRENDKPRSPSASEHRLGREAERGGAPEGEGGRTTPEVVSGEQGIRTLGTVTGTLDFESSAFDHSASSPRALVANGADASTMISRVALQPAADHDEGFMRLALEEAARAADEGEVPVGCVIVHEGRVVGLGHNLREQTQDPTSHAEVLAIRDAARTLGSWRLSGCDVYVTLEPCPMCAGALVNARVDRVIFATEDPKAGATVSLFGIGSDLRLNHRFTQTSGVLKDEASQILKDFFARIRKAQRAAKQKANAPGDADG